MLKSRAMGGFKAAGHGSALAQGTAPASLTGVAQEPNRWKKALLKSKALGAMRHAPEDAPVEYDSATEAYCLRPVVARGPAQSEFPVRCVVARRYPAPFAVFVDPGRGAYSHREEFEDRPSPADVTRAIRAALES